MNNLHNPHDATVKQEGGIAFCLYAGCHEHIGWGVFFCRHHLNSINKECFVEYENCGAAVPLL